MQNKQKGSTILVVIIVVLLVIFFYPKNGGGGKCLGVEHGICKNPGGCSTTCWGIILK